MTTAYSMGVLINSISRGMTNIIDAERRRESERAYNQRWYGTTGESQSSTMPEIKFITKSKVSSAINLVLAGAGTVGAMVAATSENDDTKTIGLYTAVGSGVILALKSAAEVASIKEG